MAVTPSNPDDAFLREVDEGVRRDQVASLWQRYGIVSIVVVVVLLAALAGWLWWRDQSAGKAGVAGEEFARAVEQLDVGEGARARPVLDRLATDGPAGYAPLARMVQASDAVASGDTARAVKLLDAVAADSKVGQPLRDAALIKSVRLGFDGLPPATVVDRLKGLAVPGNPWFGIAAEMTAIAQLKAGKPDAAKPLLTAIVLDESNSPSMRGRAAQLALSLGVDQRTLKLDAAAPSAASASTPAASPQPAP
nr:tetratricopeptide repeat protein [Polymorphobacter fuscus]